jgi:serine/threonine protein kinase
MSDRITEDVQDGLGRAFAAEARRVDGADRRLALAAIKAAVLGEAAAPLRIGRYVAHERLGAGAMGVVYAAYDPQLHRRVAIKLVQDGGAPAGAAVSQRLLLEGRALARLSHPNVVPIFDVGVFEGQVFLAMELVEGEPLSRWFQRAAPGWRPRLRALVDAGRGLAAAHAGGIVHRDFKPSNVVIGREDGRVRVLDFGLAAELAAPVRPGSERTGDDASQRATPRYY